MRRIIYTLVLALALPSVHLLAQQNSQGEQNEKQSQPSASQQSSTPQASTQSTPTSSQSDEDKDKDKEKGKHKDKDKKKHDHDKDRDRAKKGDHDRDREHENQPAATPQASMPSQQTNVAVNQQQNVEVKQKVQSALQREPRLANNVNVHVTNNNQIVLIGTVPTPEAKQRAEELARSAAGNQIVINQIQVATVASSAVPSTGGMAGTASSAPASSDTSANQASTISSNTGRQSSCPGVAGEVIPLSPGSSVNIRVSNDNRVMLTGNVPSQSEKERIQQFVQQAFGAQQVINQIQTANASYR